MDRKEVIEETPSLFQYSRHHLVDVVEPEVVDIRFTTSDLVEELPKALHFLDHPEGGTHWERERINCDTSVDDDISFISEDSDLNIPFIGSLMIHRRNTCLADDE